MLSSRSIKSGDPCWRLPSCEIIRHSLFRSSISGARTKSGWSGSVGRLRLMPVQRHDRSVTRVVTLKMSERCRATSNRRDRSKTDTGTSDHEARRSAVARGEFVRVIAASGGLEVARERALGFGRIARGRGDIEAGGKLLPRGAGRAGNAASRNVLARPGIRNGKDGQASRRRVIVSLSSDIDR